MIADAYEAFLFDLDGVLYRGADPVPGAAESLTRLRSLGKGIAFVTNNSGRTPERVAERLRSVGVDADAGEVETSALTTAAVLAERGIGRAFVVGEVGVVDALSEAGVEVATGEPDTVDAVVVGWDRNADYSKLRVASVLVQRGARLVATNPDASFPAADGTKWPGAGALLAAIETTTGVRGEVIGKPYPPLLLAAHARRRRPAAPDRRPPRHRHRRRGRPRLGFAPRAHRHQRGSRSGGVARASDLRRRRPARFVRRGLVSFGVAIAAGGGPHPRYAGEHNDDRERTSRCSSTTSAGPWKDCSAR